MGARRVATLCAPFTWLFGLGTGIAQPLPEDARTMRGVEGGDSLAHVGLLLDAGLPDGMMAALAVRPAEVVRLHFGAGSNTASAGVRGGLSILPVGHGPSFNLEVGQYLAGNTNGLVGSLFAGLGDFGSYVQRFSYRFVNAHLGLEVGSRNFAFFIHGGFTYVRAVLKDVEAPTRATATSRTTFTFTKDPILKLLAPSAKLGVVVYLQ